MTNSIIFSKKNTVNYKELRDKSFKRDVTTTALTVTASLLGTGGVIVVVCASFCFLLPGVNVINDIVIKGYFPGLGAIGLSLPFIYGSFKSSIPKNQARKNLIDYLSSKHVTPHLNRSQKTLHLFFEKHILNAEWSREYNKRLVSDLKARFPTTEDKIQDEDLKKTHEKIGKALDTALEHIQRVKQGESLKEIHKKEEKKAKKK